MSDVTVNMRQHNITVYINRLGGNGVNVITGINIAANVAKEIDTGQSSIRPRFIQLYDANGKRVDKNLPEPVVTLSTNYLITYAKQLIPYTNLTLYYI